MSDCILFDDVKTEIKKSLGSVFGPSLDDFFVDTVEKPYRRCSSLKEFRSTYMEPTLGLFRKLKNHFPLKFNRAYTVFFSKPQERLRHGDFFLQAGFSEPGKLALKFYWEDELHASTIAEWDFARLTDQEYFKKKCREAGIRANVLKKLIVIKGEEKYDRVLIENIHQLRSEISMRDSVDFAECYYNDVEVEFRRRAVSFPESLLASRSLHVTVKSQISIDLDLTFPRDTDVCSRPPIVVSTDESTDESEYNLFFGSKTAKAVSEDLVRQNSVDIVLPSAGDTDVFSRPPIMASTDALEYSLCFGSKTAKAVSEDLVRQSSVDVVFPSAGDVFSGPLVFLLFFSCFSLRRHFSPLSAKAQTSADESEYDVCFGSKTAKAVNEDSVRQDTGKDLGNNPDLITKELEKAVNLEKKQASSSEASGKKGYPSVGKALQSINNSSVVSSLKSTNSSESSDAKAKGYPSVVSSLRSEDDSEAGVCRILERGGG